jgi:hypothetical protein
VTLVLRRMRADARIKGWSDPDSWSVDDYVVIDERRIEYAVVEDTVVGRIYTEVIHGEPKWRWFVQTVPAPPPNEGMEDTLEEAKAAFKQRYEQVKLGMK